MLYPTGEVTVWTGGGEPRCAAAAAGCAVGSAAASDAATACAMTSVRGRPLVAKVGGGGGGAAAAPGGDVDATDGDDAVAVGGGTAIMHAIAGAELAARPALRIGVGGAARGPGGWPLGSSWGGAHRGDEDGLGAVSGCGVKAAKGALQAKGVCVGTAAVGDSMWCAIA